METDALPGLQEIRRLDSCGITGSVDFRYVPTQGNRGAFGSSRNGAAADGEEPTGVNASAPKTHQLSARVRYK
jgi:hypothetical protein